MRQSESKTCLACGHSYTALVRASNICRRCRDVFRKRAKRIAPLLTLCNRESNENDASTDKDIIPVGTSIIFTRTLGLPASEGQAALVFARKGESGEIAGYIGTEGYWVKANSGQQQFAAVASEFHVLG